MKVPDGIGTKERLGNVVVGELIRRGIDAKNAVIDKGQAAVVEPQLAGIVLGGHGYRMAALTGLISI